MDYLGLPYPAKEALGEPLDPREPSPLALPATAIDILGLLFILGGAIGNT
jgi:hypothetical protein